MLVTESGIVTLLSELQRRNDIVVTPLGIAILVSKLQSSKQILLIAPARDASSNEVQDLKDNSVKSPSQEIDFNFDDPLVV